MKHIKLFESFITEGYISTRDIKKWEKKNGNLPFPAEVLQASKEIESFKFAKDDELTRACLWLIFNDSKWLNMEKYGAHVKQFYGSDFYSDLSKPVMSTKAAHYATQVALSVQDKLNNYEEVQPMFYELKDYFKSFNMEYNRSRIFDSAYKMLANWAEKNNI